MEQLAWIRSERRVVTLRYAGAYGARSPRRTRCPARASMRHSLHQQKPLHPKQQQLHPASTDAFLTVAASSHIGTVDELLI